MVGQDKPRKNERTIEREILINVSALIIGTCGKKDINALLEKGCKSQTPPST
jgi:hypothetical protein